MKFVVAQETKILGTKMAKNLEVIEATTLDEAKEIYMTKFPKANNVYGYQKDEDTTTTTTNNEEEITMTTFTTISGNTFTTNEQGNYFYMIDTNGKKTRIKKSEFEAAQRENEIEREMCKPEDVDPNDPENAYPVDEQAELDKEPCRVEVNSDLYKPAVINQYGCVDCSKCNVTGCVHRDCMRRNPKSEGGLGECPRLDAKMEELDEAQDPELDQIMEETGLEPADAELERNIRNEQKKPSKPRRSKDIAYEGNGVTLTAKQVDFLRELRKTEVYEEDVNDMVVEDITITIGGQFEDKPMTVGAMISTLCEKHLGTRIKAKVGNRTMTLFGLTPSGKDIMNAIK